MRCEIGLRGAPPNATNSLSTGVSESLLAKINAHCYEPGMRGLALNFLMLFAMFCTGIHSPAQAHQIPGDLDMAAQHSDVYHAHGPDESSQDDGSDRTQPIVDHQHAPLTILSFSVEAATPVYLGGESRRPGMADPLFSVTSAPPIEPPLA